MRQSRFRIERSPKPSLRWTLELLWSLALHRVSIRYKETLFGFGWIFLQPVALTFIFTYIFHRFAKIPSGNTPYALFAATGLVAWSLTALVISQSSSSVTNHNVLLKRVALPKVLLPLSAVIATLADLGVMIVLLIGLFVYYQVPLSLTAAWALLVFAVHLALLIGLSCLVSLANVFLRDIGQAIPFLLQLWFFVSPVFYPASMVPAEFRGLAKWNPMTGIIEGYRAVLFVGKPPAWDFMGPAVLVTVCVLVAGIACFRRLEGIVADIL